MSSAEETELKAGHPPAVKAGGMRVATRHRTDSGSKKPEEMTPEEQEEFGTSPQKDKNVSQLVSGVPTKVDRDFPTAAVKQYHDKPLPTKDMPHNQPNIRSQHNIQQPR